MTQLETESVVFTWIYDFNLGSRNYRWVSFGLKGNCDKKLLFVGFLSSIMRNTDDVFVLERSHNIGLFFSYDIKYN